MALPSRLKKQEARANAYIQQRQENADRVASGQAPIMMPDPLPPAVTLEQQDPVLDQQQDDGLDDGAQHFGAQPVDDQQQIQDDQQQPPPVAGQDELESLRARVSTTDGMLRKANTETATERAKREAAEALATREADRAAQLEQELEQLRSRQPAAPVTRQDLLDYGFTEAEIEEDGEEKCIRLVNLSRNAAGAVVKAALAKARKELDADRERIRQDREAEQAASLKDRESRFWADLKAAVPDWKAINDGPETKPKWLKFLDQPNPGDHRPRQEVLNEARAALDAQRVAAIFNAFKQSQPRPAPVKDPASRVLPGSRPASQRSADAQTQGTVSRREIQEHLSKISSNRKRYRNSPEALAMQQKIDKAAAEHRIVE